jgi:serine/threonine protein kinase
LIHRDIKPSNVMLTPDNDVRIIDFGIALLKDVDMSVIQGIAGSPSYMSPEQVQSLEITKASDLYSLGAVMYEMLTGFRPYRANSLAKLLNQIVFATPAPIHSLRTDVPEELEELVVRIMQKEPQARYASGAEFAADLTRVYQQLTSRRHERIDKNEHFAILRRLNFFHDFSHAEIAELFGASEWREYAADDEIVREGELDDRFYVVVSGNCIVESGGRDIGRLKAGNCFGESGYVAEARRSATIRSEDQATILTVSATLLEQVSTECQLRFTKVFLRALIERLQGQGSTGAT